MKERLLPLAPPSSGYMADVFPSFPSVKRSTLSFLVAGSIKHVDKTTYFTGGETTDGFLLAFLVPHELAQRKGPKSLRALYRKSDGSFDEVAPQSFARLKFVRLFY